MNRFLLLIVSFLISYGTVNATLVLNGQEYATDTIFQREVGPGILHTRYRIPDYPLNVYTIVMDLTNPYNKIETTQPFNTIGKQELLADAYIRHKEEGKKPIAGANASFWVVTGHGAGWAYMLGTNFGANVLNGKILTETNAHNDIAYGGRGCLAVDKDKNLWVGAMSWYGEAKCEKWDKNLEIIQFNKICHEGELAVFTSEYGKDRAMLTNATNDNIYLNVDEGQEWAVNKDMTATVMAVSFDKASETVGDYDFCLTGSGSYKPYLQKLQPGDKITINHAWTDNKTGVKPLIENMVEGNNLVMEDGELTEANVTDGYCATVYSRCAYGMSKDRKKLYIIVIDMSTGDYGYSKGCTTGPMCEILKSMGCWAVANFDAGGSAQMMVDGAVVNKTTEGTPRSVSTSWFLYSTAPDSQEISRIEFDNFNITIPAGAVYTPRILGYNKYGELVSDNVEGVNITCTDNVGKGEGSMVKAHFTPSYGTITADYKGIKVTKPFTTVSSEMALRIKPLIVIDGARAYPVEVVSTVGRNTYLYDSADMNWELVDPTIASIEKGVLRGLKNGETTLKCSLGSFAEEVTVRVQIPEDATMGQEWSNWSLKGTGASNLAIDKDGVISFNFTAARGSNIKMTNTLPFFGLPDKITLEFTPTLPINYVQSDLRSALMTKISPVQYKNGEKAFEAGVRYTIDFDMSLLGDLNDLSIYPITMAGLSFYLQTSGVDKGEKTITIHKLEAYYNNHSSVECIDLGKVNQANLYPNPVVDGQLSISSNSDNAQLEIYSLDGAIVYRRNVEVNGGSATLDVSSVAKGVYIARIITENGNYSQKLIIK
ncbi:MAG: phosphodiester glycosidase family protein [Muribaculaceae bacterium]|nr:phosphodiester glycosidase family protein [Muribaculaceae bacterium]